jgi:hypothetical protein
MTYMGGASSHLPVSLVMLLRQPHCFSEGELRKAAEKAWGVSFEGKTPAHYFVRQSMDAALVHVRPHLISILSSDKPYFDRDPKAYAATLPRPAQQRAWTQHLAWTSIDSTRGGTNKALQYCVVAKLAAEMLDSNCTGVYVPSESSFISNDSSLYEELRRIAASCNEWNDGPV